MWKWVLVAAVGVAVGCDNSNTDGAKGAQSSSPQANDTTSAAPAGSVSAPGSYSGPGTPTELSTTRAGETAASAVVEAQRQATNNPALASATQPGAAGQQVQNQVNQAQGAAQQQGAQVQSQLDQAMQYVKDKKYDLAEKALNTLDQQRASWAPATQQQYGPKIDMAKQALAAAKGGGNALDQLKGTAFPSNTSK